MFTVIFSVAIWRYGRIRGKTFISYCCFRHTWKIVSFCCQSSGYAHDVIFPNLRLQKKKKNVTI